MVHEHLEVPAAADEGRCANVAYFGAVGDGLREILI